MEIEKDKRYEIVVFPNQDEGLKAQRILVSKGKVLLNRDTAGHFY